MFTSRYKVEALAHGLEILALFTTERPSLNLTKIVTATQLTKSTAFRMISTLELLGYLERDPETNYYRPGLKVLQLGFTALNSLELAQIAQSYLKSLSDVTGETTNMAIRDGADIIYVARNATQQIIGVNVQRGSRAPVYCTSMGKAQLIDLSREELFDLLGDGPYLKQGPNTITSLDALEAELDLVRQNGYAINDEELAFGLRSVAAPIRNLEGEVVAAINISFPGGRLSRKEIEVNMAPKIVDTASQISISMGFPSHRLKESQNSSGAP
jgi:IclR family transcriptional regulator, pca regulon regulatory protein